MCSLFIHLHSYTNTLCSWDTFILNHKAILFGRKKSKTTKTQNTKKLKNIKMVCVLKACKLIFSVFIILVDCLLMRFCWAGIRETWACASHRSVSWCCCCHLSLCWCFGFFFPSSVLLEVVPVPECLRSCYSFFLCALSQLFPHFAILWAQGMQLGCIRAGWAESLCQSRFFKELAEQELYLLIQLFAIFLPVDHSGTAWELDDAMAAQCGYAVTYTTWRNIEFRASALSCHSHLEVSLLQTFWLQSSCTLTLWVITELLMDINWGVIMSCISVSRE